MTCVVGVVDKRKIFMGADSLGSDYYVQFTVPEPKVFRNGPFLIGIAGSFRWAQLLEHALDVPLQGDAEDDRRFMVVTFVDAVRKTMKRGGFMNTEDDQESTYGDALIGYREKLYRMAGGDLQITQAAGYAAIGCGDSVALGALHALRGVNPEVRLEAALRAAAEHVPGVRGPFHYISTGDVR